MAWPPSDPTGKTRAEPSRLGPAERAADLRRLEEELFDVVVIGGGITGTGAALDAASRGLRVALVEQGDLGEGASSRSSKLIHGGLRYLEMFDFALVREALGERRRLLRVIAPHLVHKVRFTWPLRGRVWERMYLAAGLSLYDILAGRSAVPRHGHLTRGGLMRLVPSLRATTFVGGVSFHDASTDDARMVTALARTARRHGAAVVTGARATQVSYDGRRATVTLTLEADDVLSAATVSNDQPDAKIPQSTEAAGARMTLRAQHVCWAVGAGTVPGQGGDRPQVRPSKGVHLVIPKDRIQATAGLIFRTEKSLLFIIPWLGHWLVGDTDTDWPHAAPPVANAADVDYLLDKANTALSDELTREDIVGVFAGLRPLIQQDNHGGSARSSNRTSNRTGNSSTLATRAPDTSTLSRTHSVRSAGPGQTTVAGGKLTTYRVMARDLIDQAVLRAGLQAGPCTTGRLALVGAESIGVKSFDNARGSARGGVVSCTNEHLQRRYGSLASQVLAAAAHRQQRGLIETHAPYLWEEIWYAFTHEGARSITDALERRTRIKVQYPDAGSAIVTQVADIAAEVLGWNSNLRDAHVQHYLLTLNAERAALEEPDDVRAIAAYRAVLARSVPLQAETDCGYRRAR